MSYNDVIYRDLKLVGSLVADKADTQELVNLVAEHNIQVHVKKWKLEQAEEMRLEYLEGKGGGKNVITFE